MTNFNESSRSPIVIGLGEVLWDILPTGRFLGGAPANFAFHANQLGACGIVVSSIGRDISGEEIADLLNEFGMTTNYLQQNDHPTGAVTVTIDRAGNPSYVIHTEVAWDFLFCDESLLDLAREADAVCFGSLAQRSSMSRQSIQAFLRATRRDCLRVFDVNLRQHFYDVETIDESLAISDALKLSDEELPPIAQLLKLPNDDLSAAMEIIERYSLRLVALTRGANGSTIYTKHRVSHNGGYPPGKIADTMGGGDSFSAALVMGLLRFDNLDHIHDTASRLAGFVCSQEGAMPKIPNSVLLLAR